MALLDEARAWLEDDPDPRTRAELTSLIAGVEAGDAASQAALADAFRGPLEFGTAGLRGRLGPGPGRMNRVVVMRAAAGLAAYLQDHHDEGAAVVIGYDARRDSDTFARDTAAIMRGAGITAMVLPRPLPTPVLAFAIRHLGADAGVMVTASHNPPEDNGYKVYLGDGSQIVPPTDSQISTRIAAASRLPVRDLPTGDDWLTLDDDIEAAYLTRAASLVDAGREHRLRIVITPMHGVGGALLESTLERAGFPVPIRVAEQFDPDPNFPTVTFPNPEEPGAMDLALATARAHGADLVIANDPDADRCAVAIPDARSPDSRGGWRMLRGDEVGSLLGAWVIERGRRAGVPIHGVMAESLVSGSQLRSIALAAGLEHVVTLTGFKWIGRIPGLVYGYEEALGYCVDPSAVADKDGITAALLVCELAAHLAAQGRTLQDALDDLDREHGVVATEQVSIRVTDLARISQIMTELRRTPPTQVAGVAVHRFDDLAQGVDGLPPTDGVRLELADGGRIIVRPSGTEPKVKCYLQAALPPASDVRDARDRATARLAALADDVRGWLV